MRFSITRISEIISTVLKTQDTLEVYTDGSSKDGMGSWAYVISKRGTCITENAGRVRRATSNTMEFQAAIEALHSLPANSNVTLFTDSKILVDTMTSKKGHPSFQAQIDVLVLLADKHTVRWKWIKAHNGNRFNERCDELCTLVRGENPYVLNGIGPK